MVLIKLVSRRCSGLEESKEKEVEVIFLKGMIDFLKFFLAI